MFYERDKQVITLIQCLCSINAVKYWAQVTFRAGLHKVEISEFTHFKMGAIKAFKKGVLYHGENCNRGQLISL